MSSRSRVDLPQPLAPTIATNSPGSTGNDTLSSTSGPSSAYRNDRLLASIAPDNGPGAVLPPRTSGTSSNTGLICSNNGRMEAAEMSAPVSCVTEVSIIVTAVLKVRKPLADNVPRDGPASSMNITSVQNGR